MGLRAKLIVALLLVFGTLGAVIIATIQGRVMTSYGAIEFDTAQADMERLIETLDTAVRQLDDSVVEWSSRSELYEFVQSRNAKFRVENLSLQAISQVKFSWIGIYDLRGKLIASVGRDPFSRLPIEFPELADPVNPLARHLSEPPALGDSRCGLIRSQGEIYGMCRRAISDSTGEKPARGALVLLKRLGPDFMSRMKNLTQVDFSLKDIEIGSDPALLPGHRVFHTEVGSGRAHAHQTADSYTFHWNLQDVLGNGIGTLELVSPRAISQRGHRSINEAAILFSVIVGLGALAMLLVVDRLVVLRIKRLALALHEICAKRDWAQRVANSASDEIGRLGGRANELLEVIEHQVIELERTTRTDPLTGLPNRRRFDEQLPRLIRQHLRNGQPLSLVTIDVDCFKRYNDGYGHAQGDMALRIVGECLRECAQRAADLPVRVGGEEFALLLPDCTQRDARAVAESLRVALHRRKIPHAYSDAGPFLSASLGVTQLRPDDTLESFYMRADQAMYRAKASGRDRVELAEDDAGPAPK